MPRISSNELIPKARNGSLLESMPSIPLPMMLLYRAKQMCRVRKFWHFLNTETYMVGQGPPHLNYSASQSQQNRQDIAKLTFTFWIARWQSSLRPWINPDIVCMETAMQGPKSKRLLPYTNETVSFLILRETAVRARWFLVPPTMRSGVVPSGLRWSRFNSMIALTGKQRAYFRDLVKQGTVGRHAR